MQAMKSEQRLFEMRRSAREGQKAQLLEQVDQLRQQIVGNDEQVAAKSKEIEWNQQELGGIRGLWKQNLVPFNRVTTLERDSARLHGERGALTASIAQAKGRIAEIQLEDPADRRGSAHRGRQGTGRDPRQAIRADRAAGGGRGPAEAHRPGGAAGRQGLPAGRPHDRRRDPGAARC